MARFSIATRCVIGSCRLIVFVGSEMCSLPMTMNMSDHLKRAGATPGWSSFHGCHYNDVIMGAIASQITSLTIVYPTVYSDADLRKHQSSAPLAFVRGIHRGLVNSPHKWLVTRKMFPFDHVITGCATQRSQLYLYVHSVIKRIKHINPLGIIIYILWFIFHKENLNIYITSISRNWNSASAGLQYFILNHGVI